MELHMCIRNRKKKSYSVAAEGPESSAAFINKCIVSPSESVTGEQQNTIAMQTIDPKSMIKCFTEFSLCVCAHVCVYVCVYVSMWVCVCVCMCILGQFVYSWTTTGANFNKRLFGTCQEHAQG